MNDLILNGIVEKVAFFCQWDRLHWVFSAKNSWQPNAPVEFKQREETREPW